MRRNHCLNNRDLRAFAYLYFNSRLHFQTCRNLTTLQPLHNVNMTYLSKTIFRSEVTYITDAMIEWPAMNDAPLTLNDLINVCIFLLF